MAIKRYLAAAALAIAALVGTGPVAQADFGVRVGILVCDINGGPGVILGSRKALGCSFNGIRVSDEPYVGHMTRIGLDAGATGGARLVWAVFAPTLQLTPGALEGRYYGVGAEVTPGVGLGANVLIGGFDRSIILQPISVQGQVGANIAAGLGYLRLQSPPTVVIENVYKR